MRDPEVPNRVYPIEQLNDIYRFPCLHYRESCLSLATKCTASREIFWYGGFCMHTGFPAEELRAYRWAVPPAPILAHTLLFTIRLKSTIRFVSTMINLLICFYWDTKRSWNSAECPFSSNAFSHTTSVPCTYSNLLRTKAVRWANNPDEHRRWSVVGSSQIGDVVSSRFRSRFRSTVHRRHWIS